MIVKIRSFTVLITTLFITACASHPPIQTADIVNADDFKGDWYVIANIPYFAERGKVGSKTSYIPTAKEGVYKDVFSAHDETFDAPREELTGKAKVLNDEHTELQSVFYWVIRSRFSVLHMQDDWMVLGHRSRDYGWIMAREDRISEQDYQRALDILQRRGYDISRFEKVPQRPSDIGQPGFQRS
jgi:apolipoprotein D and lipocalin family protein